MKSSKRSNRRGIILLVVISSLAFFSILVATYLIFSRDSRQSSYLMASRNYRTPEVADLLDESLMTLIRGTDDALSPFFGEDLLSDYYGRRDALDFHVQNEAILPNAFQHVGGGYVRIPIRWPAVRPAALETWDDLFSGRLVTFLEGPLRNKTYRVARSRVLLPNPPATTPIVDALYIKIDDPSVPTAALTDNNPAVALPFLRPFFYRNAVAPATNGYAFHMNGVPRNSPGVGFNGTGFNLTMANIRTGSPPTANVPVGFPTLPVALQPSSIRPFEMIDKRQILGQFIPTPAPGRFDFSRGDFDEDYDAADFNDWFLSYTNPDGSIVPSFHRPAVINYILNEADWSGITDMDEYRRLLASIARGTFRPLPIGSNMLAPGSLRVNPQFTGGSSKYILRTPMRFTNPAEARLRLDQLARALVRDNDINDQWDVDNSGDGKKDSIWVDIDLPTFTSREGKILKPLIAPRIEDLSGRLNINAHDNVALNNELAALQTELANWAGTRGGYGASPLNQRTVFRGLGFGPAEIEIPAISANLTPPITPEMRVAAQLAVTQRYQSRYGVAVPGRPGPDPLDTLRSGWRPNLFTAGSGYGASLDPFGRGGVALGRDGQLVAAISGRQVLPGTNPPLDRIDEAINDPYETDPSGMSGGDSLYSFAELEPILRSNDFDIELLPQRLRNQYYELIRIHPEFANVLTTHSVSDDTPILADAQHVAFNHQLARRINQLGGGTLTGLTAPQQARFLSQLVAPEFRLGRKLDVNRPFGNGIDDTTFVANVNNGFGVIDEPREVSPGVLLRTNPGEPLQPVTGPTVPSDFTGIVIAPAETQTFAINAGSGQTIPAAYQGIPPRYNLVDANDEQVYIHTAPNRIYPFDIERDWNGTPLGRQVTARQLMARHLYVLMMILTRDYEFPSMSDTFNPARTRAADFDPAFYKARRLAQWAVNVVDYRDSDSIMTRFVFDPNPFNGWSPPAEPAPPQNVVWGVESPELLFSESLAFHDLRVRDTNRANTTGTPREGSPDTRKNEPNDPNDPNEEPDPNTDQVRKPEGSLFLELYCARSQVIGDPEQSTKPGVPRELYNIDLPSGVAELDLVRAAPHRLDPNGLNPNLEGAPVWRIAISERHDATNPNGVDPNLTDPQLLREAFPDSFSPETAHPNELGLVRPVAEQLKYDRYIWFRSFANRNEIETLINNNAIRGNGNMLMEPDAVFFAPEATALNQRSGNNAINTMRQLQPGQFLSLAPREVTYLGSTRTNVPSTHRFEVIDNDATNTTNDLDVSQWGVVQFNQNNQRTTPLLGPTNHHTASLPMIIGAIRPDGWNANSFQNGFIGLNVSEPLATGYYPPTLFQYNGDTNSATVPQGIDYPLFDAYLDLTTTENTARDMPVDIEFNADRIPNDGIEPIPGTVPNYCTAFLQRLADPTVPYDPLFNPYRTIDWLTIDLTVFSGEEDATKVVDDPALNYALRSRQRNGFIGMNPQNALFSNETNRPIDETGAFLAFGDHYFTLTSPLPNFSLQNSLSFLNTNTSGSGAVNNLTGRSNPDFIGFSQSIGSDAAATNVQGNDRNLPNIPYAVHPWLNRPFATHFELMMVPASSAGRLFEEFSINVNAGADPDVFPRVLVDPTRFHGPFRHLLNFFHSHPDPTIGASFAGLFDMVHTLPRFKGEVEVIPPSALNLASTAPGGLGDDDFFRSLFRPPYNLAYDNQRLGRINVNSITEFAVWAGLMKGHLNQGEFTLPDGAGTATQFSFNEFIASRRGYASPSHGVVPLPNVGIGAPPINYDPVNLNPLYPTRFLGAYRGHQSAAFSPPLRGAGPVPAPNPNEVARRRGVNATPLRTAGPIEQADPGGATGNPIAQFVRAAGQAPNEIHRNRDRSAFTRYQSLMRLPNLISDNSQVYMIRLTMGFFEVDVATGNLGREYNEDVGQNHRYRALYIIDRSKEVGFIPGQNLNARDVVLFESYAQ